MWSWAACFTVLCWGRRWMAWCSYREWHLVNYFWASHVGHFVFWCTWCFPQQISGILFSNFSFSPWTLTYACIFICTCMHLPPLSFYCLSTSIGFIFTILSKIGEMEVIKRKIWNWINWIRLGVLNSVLLSPHSANYLREILFIFSFFLLETLLTIEEITKRWAQQFTKWLIEQKIQNCQEIHLTAASWYSWIQRKMEYSFEFVNHYKQMPRNELYTKKISI